MTTIKRRNTAASKALEPTNVIPPSQAVDRTPDEWAEIIKQDWRSLAENIIITGQDLTEAKEQLKDAFGHGSWEEWATANLPFTLETAVRLMKIASHPVLSNPAHVQVLPPSWGTIYELTKWPEDAIETAIDDETINPRMTRKEAVTRRPDYKPGARRRGSRPPRAQQMSPPSVPEIVDHDGPAYRLASLMLPMCAGVESNKELLDALKNEIPGKVTQEFAGIRVTITFEATEYQEE